MPRQTSRDTSSGKEFAHWTAHGCSRIVASTALAWARVISGCGFGVRGAFGACGQAGRASWPPVGLPVAGSRSGGVPRCPRRTGASRSPLVEVAALVQGRRKDPLPTSTSNVHTGGELAGRVPDVGSRWLPKVVVESAAAGNDRGRCGQGAVSPPASEVPRAPACPPPRRCRG